MDTVLPEDIPSFGVLMMVVESHVILLLIKLFSVSLIIFQDVSFNLSPVRSSPILQWSNFSTYACVCTQSLILQPLIVNTLGFISMILDKKEVQDYRLKWRNTATQAFQPNKQIQINERTWDCITKTNKCKKNLLQLSNHNKWHAFRPILCWHFYRI